MIIPQSFYNRSARLVAQDLLGCFLVRRFGRDTVKAMITETEAYCGPRDLASHASRGRTPRNAVMFGPPGIFYVYFTYGMHFMLNIVTGPKDYPAAVLIRSTENKIIQNSKFKIQNYKTNGPAKLTKSLNIDKSFNGLPADTKKHGLWIEAREDMVRPRDIARAARVGIDYAGPYKNKKWRYYLKNSSSVSKKN